MGQPTAHTPALLLLAAFSRYDEALDWARKKSVETWGTVLIESPPFDFKETDYYSATMGTKLKKQFFAFQWPFDPANMPDIKLETNRWEEEYAAEAKHREPRPLNLDPGYLTLGKLILASTKDFAHRIYLSKGIYAEVTLKYRHNQWEGHEYTFPDYRRADYHKFFSDCRDILHRRLRERE